MNNIDELVEIIKELNNSAQFDDIIKFFQIRHNMLLFYNHKKLILDQLQNNQDIFNYDSQQNVWSLVDNKTDNDDLRLKAKLFNGGVNKLIKLLDNYKVAYKLTSKEPSARISVDTIYGNIGIYDRKKEIKVRADIPFDHPLSKNYENIGGYLYNDNNINYKTNSYISVYFDEISFDDLSIQLKKYQDSNSIKLSIDELKNVLKEVKDLDPNVHDGSYELVQKTIIEYTKLKDLSSVNVDDMNFIYPMSVGSWKISFDIRKNRLSNTHLIDESKKVLNSVLDSVWNKACKNEYDNEKIAPKNPAVGMFGTGFMSFTGKLSDHDANKFIEMLTKIVDMDDDNEIYSLCETYINDDSFVANGLKSASASAILHCLKPRVFPVLNANDGHGTIFDKLGINIEKPKEIKYYISNCRKIKKFRDDNFMFKNYRILDMAAWVLDDPNFNLLEYV